MSKQSLILHLSTRGDRSVGIWPVTVDIETHWPDMDQETRELFREEFSACLSRMFDERTRYAFFSDECSECGKRLEDEKCPNRNCYTNQPEEETR